MANLIDGKAHAAELRTRLRDDVVTFVGAAGRPPRLEVVLVGDHPASASYVASKAKMAAEIGIHANVCRLPEEIGQLELIRRLEALNGDGEVDGILVQLPLPGHIAGRQVLETIDPDKDVDGFHPINVGRLTAAGAGEIDRILIPCTPLGCLMLLQSTLGPDGLAGRRAVVLGRSNIVGKPMATLLLASDCTVTVVHSRTRDLAAECRRAEILVVAAGRPELVRGEWVAPGTVVIDVGINRVTRADGVSRLVGDVAFAEVADKAGAITPVPGGVGPMTVACLLRNTVSAACRRMGVAVDGQATARRSTTAGSLST
jgi:methylenetetrahydrofolate dehydrogenase (NADP+)/methenyltetrahydrofolate cyclohydrolase